MWDDVCSPRIGDVRMSKRLILAFGNISAVLLLLVLPALSNAQASDTGIEQPPTAEFHFARLVYSNAIGSRRALRGGSGAWSTDYADAEYHLMQGINRLSRIDGEVVDYNGDGGRLITLNDDTIFDYPWLYAVEVGQWYLSNAEATLLREYLLPDEHELMHVHYDLHQRTQIPGRNGSRPGTTPHWRAIFDDDGRVMVAINFNMDMGDAWEHADDPMYPQPMTALFLHGSNNLVIASTTT